MTQSLAGGGGLLQSRQLLCCYNTPELKVGHYVVAWTGLSAGLTLTTHHQHVVPGH